MEKPLISEKDTIKVTVTYRGKLYGSTHKVSNDIIAIEGGVADVLKREVKVAALKCMHEALVAEGEI